MLLKYSEMLEALRCHYKEATCVDCPLKKYKGDPLQPDCFTLRGKVVSALVDYELWKRPEEVSELTATAPVLIFHKKCHYPIVAKPWYDKEESPAKLLGFFSRPNDEWIPLEDVRLWKKIPAAGNDTLFVLDD